MDSNKQTAFAIVEYLQKSIADGVVREDDKEGLETAIQCIEEAFSISSADEAQYSLKPSSLKSLVEVYAKTKAKSTSKQPAAAPSSSSSSAPTAHTKQQADEFKTQGNTAMAAKNYTAAIESYSKSINLIPDDPVYYSNRAAAYSQVSKHDLAIKDAQKASELDPTFSKAYSRLGHALFCEGRFKESVEAYEKGLQLDPANQSMKNSLNTAKTRLGEEDDAAIDSDEDDVGGPDRNVSPNAAGANPLAGLAGLMGGGGAGGMPDLASLMQNPQMMAMAQQMMGNGGLQAMMQNPMIRQMAERMQSGGGMPDMGQLGSMMNDPSIRQMAESFGGRGGGAAGRGAGRGSGNDDNNDMYS